MAAYNNDAEADEIVRREAARQGLTETTYRMLKAAPTDLVRSIVFDHVGKPDVTQPSSMAATPERSAPKRGTGWVEARPLEKQPGIDLIDQMVENQTALERIQTAHERAKVTLDLKAYQLQQEQEREARRRDRELDPVNLGLYKSKDERDRGE
jgi:hypothetical protein